MQSQSSDYKKQFGNMDLHSDRVSQLFNLESIQSKSPNIINNDSDHDHDEQNVLMDFNQNFQPTLHGVGPGMFGTGPQIYGTGAILMGGTKSKLSLASGISKLSHTNFLSQLSAIKFPQPIAQSMWKLGQKMTESGNGHLMAIGETLSERGCYMCNGYGHNVNNCYTGRIIRKMASSSPFVRKMVNKAVTWVKSNQSHIKEDKWVIQKIILTLCHAMYKSNRDYKDVSYAIAQEFVQLELTLCHHCGGYGHLSVQQSYFRQKKKGIKHKFDDEIEPVNVACYTKLQIERQLQGFFSALKQYQLIIAEVRKVQRTFSSGEESLSDLVAYFSKTDVVNIDKISPEVQQSFRKVVRESISNARLFIKQLSASVKSSMADAQDRLVNVQLINKDIEEEAEDDPEVANEVAEEKQEEAKLEESAAVVENFILPLKQILSKSGVGIVTEITKKVQFKISLFPELTKMKRRAGIKYSMQTATTALKNAFQFIFDNFKGITKNVAIEEIENNKGLTRIINLILNSKPDSSLQYHWLFDNEDSATYYYNLAVALQKTNMMNQILQTKGDGGIIKFIAKYKASFKLVLPSANVEGPFFEGDNKTKKMVPLTFGTDVNHKQQGVEPEGEEME